MAITTELSKYKLEKYEEAKHYRDGTQLPGEGPKPATHIQIEENHMMWQNIQKVIEAFHYENSSGLTTILSEELEFSRDKHIAEL